MLSLLVVTVLAPPSIQLPVRVDGEGHLRFVQDGKTVYTREATLVVNQGKLAAAEGPVVLPTITVPATTKSLRVDLDGTVLNDTGKALGRLVLALFPADAPFTGTGKFKSTLKKPRLLSPGDETAGVIRATASSQLTAAQTFVREGGIEIVIRDLSELESASFTLGDIATINASDATKAKLSAIVLSQTPPFGVDRVLDRTLITAKLRNAGYDPAKLVIIGSSQARVRRKGQLVSHEDFVAQAIAAASSKFGGSATPEVKSPVAPLSVPPGQVELVAERVTKSGSVVSVVIAAFVDGKRINSRTVSLVNASADLLVKPGDNVKVRVRSGGISIETTGRVKAVDPVEGTVTVTLATGATKTGIPGSDGFIEVIA